MPTIIINGIPISNAYRNGYLDSYYAPQTRHLRDITEAEDVEFEEIYEQSNNDNDNENNQTMVE